MHSNKSLIDNFWPFHQSLHGHYSPRSYFPSHHHGTLGRQSASITMAPCKVHKRNTAATNVTPHCTPRSNIKHSPVVTASTQHIKQARHSSVYGKQADSWTSKNIKATGWTNKPNRCLTGVWLKCLLSGGTLSLCGQPERLRWWGYSPVTWPVPSQPGVGHRLSFLSAREASVIRKSYRGHHIWQNRGLQPRRYKKLFLKI